jgi:rhamnogalacturonyl hydrolase YesR
MRLSQLTGEPRWMASVREQVRPWLAGERAVFGQRVSLTTVAGTMVFAHLAGVDSEALPLAVEGATRATGRKADGTAEYGGGWTDDMFMATSVLARTAALDGRAGDLDTAARLIADYAQRLQRPDGLFIHAAQMPAAWGRGNGFAALALAEALTALPATGPARQTLLAIYRRQMKALAETQAPDGAWTNVVDEPGAYREASATAMLFTAVARGIRLGWLDRAEYLPVAQRAWTAVAVHVAEDGSIVDVCESTPGGSTRRYYLDRRPITGADDRGGAMALLAALERHELGS